MDEKKIKTRAEDYNEWYLDVIAGADMAEHSPVKGCMIIKPYGYAIWERMQEVLNAEIKKTGVKNAYFPLFIPKSFLTKEENHVEGFAPEVAAITEAGGVPLDEPLVVRPTSETIMYDTFSRWVQSYRDLPLLINQWANVVRWEKRTRLFLRTTEFLWQEGHTVHSTEAEADLRAREMLEVYRAFAEDVLAVPVIPGVKSDSERFAGAEKTYCVEAMMQDGKALQFGTSHMLGQNFAKAFGVKFTDEQNKEQFAWQTSWGVSTRMIGGLIMTHSDDAGLVLPPNIAPIEVVLLPLWFKEEQKESVMSAVAALRAGLEKKGVRVEVEARDMRPGEKMFYWEKRGVPVRIEVGPRDLEAGQCIIARRDTSEKMTVPLKDAVSATRKLLKAIQKNLFKRALTLRKTRTVSAKNWTAFTRAIEEGKFVLAHWDGSPETEKVIKEETGATIRCIPFSEPETAGVCIKTGAPSKRRVIFAKSY